MTKQAGSFISSPSLCSSASSSSRIPSQSDLADFTTLKLPPKHIASAELNEIRRLTEVQKGDVLEIQSHRNLQEIESGWSKQLNQAMKEAGIVRGNNAFCGFEAVFAVTLGDYSSHVVKVWSSLNVHVLALLVREDPHGVSIESSNPHNKITSAISSDQID